MAYGEVVIVTGAFSGIGQATVQLLMQQRYKVVAVGRNPEKALPSYAGNFLPIIRNLRDEEDAHEVVEFAHEKFGHVDDLVLCAGSLMQQSVFELNQTLIDRALQDNFYAAVNLAQAVLPELRARNRGTIIFLLGLQALQRMAHTTAYEAAKWGLQGYMNGLRKELAHTNVDVHGLDFGPVDTPFWQAAPYAKPTKGIQTTHDVARQILYQLQKTKLTEDHSAKLST